MHEWVFPISYRTQSFVDEEPMLSLISKTCNTLLWAREAVQESEALSADFD